MFRRTVTLAEAEHLPRWRRPESLLVLMAAAMPIAFATWSALLNNFVIEVAGFTGVEIGWLHTVREIPGFLAIGVILLLLFIREQILGVVALILLGCATAVTAYFPSFGGILYITLFSSIGFHYFETVNQSLQLQWVSRERAPHLLGWLVTVGSAASLVAYGIIVATWDLLGLDYNTVYLASGGLTVMIALFCLFAYPQFEAPHPQNKTMVLRRRYWLYYMLQLMAGARRQIFVVFAAFMMVEHFGFSVNQVTALFLINFLANMLIGPLIGRWLAKYGERRMLMVENAGVAIVFMAYGGIYAFGWGAAIGAALYVIDHLFFAMSFSLKTYFQKIGDKADMAPTAAVAFTINHIAAVILPVSLGYLWVQSPESVFVFASVMAFISLILVFLVPQDPGPGNETIFSSRRFAPFPAE